MCWLNGLAALRDAVAAGESGREQRRHQGTQETYADADDRDHHQKFHERRAHGGA